MARRTPTPEQKQAAEERRAKMRELAKAVSAMHDRRQEGGQDPMTAYRSPLRPLDIGYVERLAGIAIDWDSTDIGPIDTETIRTRRYGFAAPLPAAIVAALDLEEA